MSVLSPPWPSQPSPWNGYSAASFSALAAPVIPPLSPPHSPFHPPTHSQSAFSALAASPPRRSTHPQTQHRQTPVPGPSAFGGLPQRNTRSLDRNDLVQILIYLSTLLPARFGKGKQIRLVIHGGAVMLLNTELARLAEATAAADGRAKQRTTTRDVDYIARSFASEWAQRYSVFDANDRLKQCIFETALQFGLGADWMNSDPDVALPMATDPTTGTVYDPIHAASIQPADALTVFTSPNGLLRLVSVTPFWTVALKMVRYNPVDRGDICILLRSGTQARQLHWTPALLENWLLGTCWAMGYSNYDQERIKEVRRRMIEVVAEANRWDPHAIADDGRGGFIPLRPGGGAYPPGAAYGYGGYGYMQPPPPMYNGQGQMPAGVGPGNDPRFHGPFQSPEHSPRSHTFPPSGPPSPFVLGPAPTPPPPVSPKKKKKSKTKTQTTAITQWPSSWTALPPSGSERWDPDSPEQWDADVWKTAEKEKKYGRMTSWLPFLRHTSSPPPKAGKRSKRQRRPPTPTFSDSEDSDSDSDDSDDSDWLPREQQRWGVLGRGAGGGGMGPVFQQNVADFMSNGMTPGPAHAPGAPMPGWNVPGALRSQQQSPQSWRYAPHPQTRPDVGGVAAGMNALGLYGV
ncbi:hypothetical protein B0H10DRAFT_8284 [Mycena sp. CBHHK59/15]|nr:hypothetical protein B0H10DRAFT_8284 [Mycena sp. CBHHK59/15]